jgi:hypothetical protein
MTNSIVEDLFEQVERHMLAIQRHAVDIAENIKQTQDKCDEQTR